MDKNFRIDEIVTRLNAASDAYYGGQEEEMTNYEWDALFDELTALEKETGYVRPDSPTQDEPFRKRNGRRGGEGSA